MPERAVVYCRVSSTPQEDPDKVSLRNQEACCRVFATTRATQ
jgi:DNA invertase Pin-like site-specific DNA recombinase